MKKFKGFAAAFQFESHPDPLCLDEMLFDNSLQNAL